MLRTWACFHGLKGGGDCRLKTRGSKQKRALTLIWFASSWADARAARDNKPDRIAANRKTDDKRRRCASRIAVFAHMSNQGEGAIVLHFA